MQAVPQEVLAVWRFVLHKTRPVGFSEVIAAQQSKNQAHAVLQVACAAMWVYLIQHGKDYLPRLFIVLFFIFFF